MIKKSIIDSFYTAFLGSGSMKKKADRPGRTGPWEPTRTPNLLRNRSSGVYYARFRIDGKLVWRTLETDVYTTAKLRPPDKIEEERKLVAAGDGQITFEQAAKIFGSASIAIPASRSEPRNTVSSG